MNHMLTINTAKCSGCGACLVYSGLVQERSDGKVEVKAVRALTPGEMTSAQEMVDICLDQAITVVPMQASGTDVKTLVQKAAQELGKIQINHVSEGSLKPNLNDYSISFTVDFSRRSDHKSYDKAIRQCRDMFERYAYRQRDKAVMSVLQEYKVRHMKQYYLFTEDSFYGQINRQVSEVLSQLQQDVFAATGGQVTLPADFAVVNLYPNQCVDKYWVEDVVEFESKSQAGRKVEAEFKDCSFTALAEYETYMDAWDWEDHRDKTWYQPEYPQEALDELAKDLMNAIGYADIHEIAAMCINRLIDGYAKALRKLIDDRLALVTA